MNSLNVGRIKLCAATTAAAEKVLNISISYALQRKQFNTAIIDYGAIQEKFAHMATKTYASNAALYRAGNDIETKISELIKNGTEKNRCKTSVTSQLCCGMCDNESLWFRGNNVCFRSSDSNSWWNGILSRHTGRTCLQRC